MTDLSACAAVSVDNVTKRLGAYTLNSVTFSVPCGSVVGLIGENGAGKSTLIKILFGAMTADSGSVSLFGQKLDSPAFPELKNEIGVVLDDAPFPEMLTAKQLGRILKGLYRGYSPELYEKHLRRFALPSDQKIGAYSRGMRMKLAIAAALSHHPRLLLLDEPTGGLDLLVRDELMSLFSEYVSEGVSILISSHIVSDLEKLCDYIAFLHKGQLLFFEEKDRLLEKYTLIKLSRADFEALDRGAVIGKRENAYCIEALVKKDEIPKSFAHEHTTLEDIILYFTKGVDEP